MATTKQEFVDVINELFVEFADFLSPGTFTRKGDVDRSTGQSNNEVTQTAQGIQTKFAYKTFGDRFVKAGDFTQIYKYADLDFVPSPDIDFVTRDGIESRIIDVSVDSAQAGVYLHLRAL